MKILNLDHYLYSQKAKTRLESLGTVEELSFHRAQLLEKIPEVDVLILRFSHRIDREVMERARNLKVIATNATGTDHIDLECASEKGITVISLKGEYEFLRSIHATAELTWGLILSGIRNIAGAAESVRNGQWNRNEFLGQELYGKRLGIIGLGRIGEKIAQYGSAFGMEVCAYDINDQVFSNWPLVQKVALLEDCISRSDVLTVHVPHEASTQNLIGEMQFSLMKKSCFFVNTSRGSIVDESALLNALRTEEIAGAAIDVLNGENRDSFLVDNALIDYAKSNHNLIITPHIGGVTEQSWEKTELFIAEKVRKYFDAKENSSNGD